MLPKIREAGLSLRKVVEFALPRMTVDSPTFKVVVKRMREEKDALHKKGDLRDHSITTFNSLTKKILEAFSELEIKDLTKEDVVSWLSIDLGDLAGRTLKNHFSCLNEVLSYSVAKGYAFENVLDRITKFEKKLLVGIESESQPEILSLGETEKLLETAVEHPELNLLASLVLGLFCGIRTEELQRLKWADIRLDEGFVCVGKAIAKKRKMRNVSIPENAKIWLSLCPQNTDSLICEHQSEYRNRFDKLLRFAGFIHPDQRKNSSRQFVVKWKRNALRHSYGSYHYALYGDSILTSKEMGHKQGDDVLFTHYRALATRAQAEKYFGLVPVSGKNKIVEFAS